jgi:tetratricopeptide (TPR) repeat protein
MPAPEELPESMRSLSFRNGTQIRPALDFNVDMARLIKNLRRHFDVNPAEDGDEPAAADPSPDAGPTEKRSRAKADLQRDTAAKRGKATGAQVEVEEEDRARHRAELGIGQQQRKKRWATRLGLLAVVMLAGAAWYFVDGNQETVQAVMSAAQTGTLETEPNVDASDDAEATLADDTVGTGEAEIGEPTELAAAIFGDATAGDDAEAALDPEAEVVLGPEAEVVLGPEVEVVFGPEVEVVLDPEVEVVLDPVADDAVTTPELAVEAASETSDQAEAAVDESVVDVEASIAASDDAQPQPSASEFISEGVRLAGNGEHEAAIQNFDDAIQLNADESFFYNQRGTSYQALGQYEAAIKDYDEAIRLNGEDVNAYYRRGASHYSLEDFSAAVTDFDVVIQLDPEFANAYSRRADAHEALGDAEAAARDRATAAELIAD